MAQTADRRRYASVYATDQTDIETAAASAQSDAAATATIDALFRAHYRRLCRLVYRIIGDADLAEELAAEAFWRLHQRPPARLTNAAAWLCRTAVRLAMDRLRKDKRRQHYEESAPPPDRPAAPDEALARERERARVRTVLAAMRPAQAMLLVLRAEGVSYADAAAALRINPSSVGTMVSRAEARFKREYEVRYEGI